LLDAMTACFPKDPVRYVPLDVSENALISSATRLLKEYPTLEISGFLGDFDHSLEGLLANPQPTGEVRTVGSERLVAFLGGTIGNLALERRQTFLRRLSVLLKQGDHLLVGVDLVKEARALEAAYDDAAGVTARFNKNLLNVLNRKLGGAFDPTLFAHRAVYNVEGARIEMWLDSQVAQKVPLTALGLEVPFEAGEGIRTEISAKFTSSTVEHMLEEAGFLLTEWYTDEGRLFGLALGSRGANSTPSRKLTLLSGRPTFRAFSLDK
jgi:L-histidine Nalpha-methyltransferase